MLSAAPWFEPSPKEISPSLWLPSGLPTSRPIWVSDQSAGALGVTGAATGPAPSIIPVPPPPATCAPRGDRAPPGAAPGDPGSASSRHSPGCSVGPPRQPCATARATSGTDTPRQLAAGTGSSWGASGACPGAEPGNRHPPAPHTCPALPPARCQPRHPRVTLLSPGTEPVPAVLVTACAAGKTNPH